MDALAYAVLFALGLTGGFFSGLLGIGGGIIMVPLLLYVPPLFGLTPMPMRVVAGITAVQSFVGAASGAVGHNRYNRVHIPLALYLGIPMALSSLVGSVASAHVSNELMLTIFAAMALLAAILILLPQSDTDTEDNIVDLKFNRFFAIAIGLIIGGLAGIIGQGGAFLYIPAMLFILGIPTRITIGTALAVGIASSAAVLLGRIGTHQIPWLWSAVLVTGVVLGAQLGSVLSQYTPRRVLRKILAVIIAGTTLKIWWELL